MRIHLVCGARPNFMKIAPLYHALQREPWADPIIVHTGQHYDVNMSDAFFQDLGLPSPDIHLGVGSGSHAEQTARVMTSFEPVCLRDKPDWVVVVGDVNSTMACTIVASKLRIKTAHVEAGLRSFDRTMPEEINRLVTDALADLLLTPSADADENLKREGIDPAKIRFVGNIMIDTLVANLDKARSSMLREKVGIKPREFVYITLHRPSNVDEKESLGKIMDQLGSLAQRLQVVFPMHPRTKKMLARFNISVNGQPNMKILDPIGYHDSLYLTQNARFVLTDSGGLQEESTYLRTPCLTLRPNTERPVTITCGTNKLTTLGELEQDFERVLNGNHPKGSIPELWDGHTAERIIEILSKS